MKDQNNNDKVVEEPNEENLQMLTFNLLNEFFDMNPSLFSELTAESFNTDASSTVIVEASGTEEMQFLRKCLVCGWTSSNGCLQ